MFKSVNYLISETDRKEWTGKAVELSLDATKVKDFTNVLETTQMHIFLAAWTLWSGYQEPYIVDIIKRALC